MPNTRTICLLRIRSRGTPLPWKYHHSTLEGKLTRSRVLVPQRNVSRISGRGSTYSKHVNITFLSTTLPFFSIRKIKLSSMYFISPQWRNWEESIWWVLTAISSRLGGCNICFWLNIACLFNEGKLCRISRSICRSKYSKFLCARAVSMISNSEREMPTEKVYVEGKSTLQTIVKGKLNRN